MFYTGIIVFAAAGLVIGSFLNMCIHRLPRDLSIVYPSSFCIKCGHKLGFPDLVPVISYLLLGGKCRYCRAQIPARYVYTEILTAVLFVLSFFMFGFTADSIFTCIFVSLIILVTFSDLETQIIPDQASFIGITAGLIYGWTKGRFISSLIGLILCAAIMYGIYKIGTRVYKKEAMGGGDIKLAAFFGAFFGLQNGLLCLFLSFMVGAVISSAYIVVAGKGRHDEVPFGPAMTVAALITLFLGGKIWAWYLGF
jgi:leader peptidase (prepilin peptidase)/N-methyltransferase